MRFELKDEFRFNVDWLEDSIEEWIPFLQRDLMTYWEREADPNTGRPWAPLSPRYRAWKIRNYGNLPKLLRSGEMLTTTTLRREGNSVVANVPSYGNLHMTGTSKMPARPWLGVPPIALGHFSRVALSNILRQPRRS